MKLPVRIDDGKRPLALVLFHEHQRLFQRAALFDRQTALPLGHPNNVLLGDF